MSLQNEKMTIDELCAKVTEQAKSRGISFGAILNVYADPSLVKEDSTLPSGLISTENYHFNICIGPTKEPNKIRIKSVSLVCEEV